MHLNQLRKLAGIQLTEAAGGNSLVHISYAVESSEGYDHVIGPEPVVREAFVKMVQQLIKNNPKATKTVAKLTTALAALEKGDWDPLAEAEGFQVTKFSPNDIIEIGDHGESSKLKASNIEDVAKAVWYPFGDVKGITD